MIRRNLTAGAALLLVGLGGACGGPSFAPPIDPVGPYRVSGGTVVQQALLTTAVDQVQHLWADERFWALVKQRRWLPGPHQDSISGADLYAALHPLAPSSHLYSLESLGRRTTGATVACGWIRINEDKVSTGSYLLNTVAHENTHFIGAGTGDLGCKGPGGGDSLYLDRGVKRTSMPWLVSYAFGDLAQCFLDARGDEQGTRSCFAHTVNGSHATTCRHWEECCRATSNKKVAAIQSSSGLCASPCKDFGTECSSAHEEIKLEEEMQNAE